MAKICWVALDGSIFPEEMAAEEYEQGLFDDWLDGEPNIPADTLRTMCKNSSVAHDLVMGAFKEDIRKKLAASSGISTNQGEINRVLNRL